MPLKPGKWARRIDIQEDPDPASGIPCKMHDYLGCERQVSAWKHSKKSFLRERQSVGQMAWF
jgi:hypothetical protein